MEMPDQFEKNVTHYGKEKGTKWLQKLPQLMAYCERKWGIRAGEPFDLSFNYVAPACAQNGEEYVLKLCLPGHECDSEIYALTQLQNSSTVRLIDYSREYGAILFEKLKPGYTLATVTNEMEACEIAASVFADITRPAVPDDAAVASVKDREDNFRNIVENSPNGKGPVSAKVLQSAYEMYAYLTSSTSETWFLHGDYHHYNILNAGKGEWKVIDPKGLTGEREYDLIQFLLNNLPEHHVMETIQQRMHIFEEKLNLDMQRFIMWGYAHTVLATAWSVQGQDCSWPFYQCIDIFGRLCDQL